MEASAGGELSPAAQCEELGRLLGSPGDARDEICRVTFPRSDLSVSLLGASLPAGMGLTSWAAFGPAGERSAVVMGDLALTSDELPRVMAGLREHGIRVTAVHRHMLGEQPAMSFLHYLGIGEEADLARGLRAALDLASGPGSQGAGRAAGDNSGQEGADRMQEGVVAGVGCAQIAETLGTDPSAASGGPGYCKASIPRSDLNVRVDDIPVSAAMGIGSWFAFRETTDGREAVIAGDMALTQQQVNPAIAALRTGGVDIVALHNHMMLEEPRIMFFHFQARGEPLSLARALRSGLDAAAESGPSR